MKFRRDFAAIGEILDAGGLIAYPTETVYGLGCLPQRDDAVAQLIALKRRDIRKGLILIAADADQLAGWISDDSVAALREADVDRPVSWIVPAGPAATAQITGGRDTVAVRITTHPVAASICRIADSPLVSTSANHKGGAPLRDVHAVRRQFGAWVDRIVSGRHNAKARPSEIRVLATGKTVRPGG